MIALLLWLRYYMFSVILCVLVIVVFCYYFWGGCDLKCIVVLGVLVAIFRSFLKVGGMRVFVGLKIVVLVMAGLLWVL